MTSKSKVSEGAEGTTSIIGSHWPPCSGRISPSLRSRLFSRLSGFAFTLLKTRGPVPLHVVWIPRISFRVSDNVRSDLAEAFTDRLVDKLRGVRLNCSAV